MGWLVGEVLVKLAMYIGIAGTIGAIACRWLCQHRGYNEYLRGQAKGYASLGLIAVMTGFFVSVGAFNEEGLAGMLDRDIAQMLWDSSIGSSAVMRLAALVLVLIALFQGVSVMLSVPLQIAAIVMLGASFTLVGHTVELSILAQVAITLHIIALSLWAGSFMPLLQMLNRLSLDDAQRAMVYYGKLAVVVIASLLLSGGYLVIELFDVELGLASNYNRLMVLKLAIVLCLLALGARNKLQLVGRLTAKESSLSTLKLAITFELVLAMVVLLVTGIFTTVMGPA